MRINPILIPKSFNTVLESLNKGLEYIIKLDPRGFCPFLKLNFCSIHQYKPIVCKRFPYKKEGTLRNDENFFSICQGLSL